MGGAQDTQTDDNTANHPVRVPPRNREIVFTRGQTGAGLGEMAGSNRD